MNDQQKEQGQQQDRRTVFVRGLAPTVDDDQLADTFSSIGPVKHAFLVKDRSTGKHKGFGFVQFALEEDAVRAAQEMNGTKVEGRAVKVESALKRASFEQRKKNKKVDLDDEGEGNEQKSDHKLQKTAGPRTVQEESMKKHQLVKTLAVGGMLKDDVPGFLDMIRKHENVEDVTHPAPASVIRQYKLEEDGCSGEVVLVRYSTAKAMMKAAEEFHKTETKLSKKKGAASVVLWARQVSGEGRHLKRWRLVVRNLPFKATESDVREAFSNIGLIWEITMPRLTTGESRGFAFVGFTCKAHAERGISKVNGTTICGRTVAVDWSVSKRDFGKKDEEDRHVGDDTEPVPHDSGGEEVGEDGTKIIPGQEFDDEHEGIQVDTEKERDIMHNVLDSILQKDSKEDLIEDGMDLEDKKEDEKHSQEESSQEGSLEGNEYSEEQDGLKRKEDIIRQVDQKAEALASILNRDKRKKDVESIPGATVFIRKVPVDATKNDLFTSMKRFGRLGSIRLVYDRLTKNPKGTAFVDYETVEGAQAAAAACQKAREKIGPPVVIAGMPVEVDIALDGDSIRSLAKENADKHKDRRNLYLAKEGQIAEGTPAWEHLSNSDKAKRLRAIQESTLKLKSPNFAVSNTRLNVRNVPKTWDEKKLKKLFVDAVLKRATKAKPQVVQVKILREQSIDGALGASKGIAFVEFSEHEHSLCALRELNNNPTIWGKDHRPIIEFAIDNVQALKVRTEKLAKQKQAREKDSHGSTADTTEDIKPKGSNRTKRSLDSSDDQETHTKSKRKLRMERRAMLKQKARASQGQKEEQMREAGKTKSQKRREQRKRKQGIGSEDMIAAGMKDAPKSIVSSSTAKRKLSADPMLDALASSLDGVQRKKPKRNKNVDLVDSLATKLYSVPKKKTSARKEKRWFE